MPKFQLFRLKVLPSVQGGLFREDLDRKEIITRVVFSSPSVESMKTVTWHIGNVESVDKNSIYFRIGKTSDSTIEVYQEGEFTEQDLETAPYTHAFIELNFEVIAIAKKSRLASSTEAISRRLEELLNASEQASELEATFEVKVLKDPNDFIEYLKGAYVVKKFSVTFHRPNPWDVNEMFNEPMENFLEAANGERGEAEIEGEELDPEKLEDVARSAASTGDEATAMLKEREDGQLIKKKLSQNPVMIAVEEVEEQEDKIGIVRLLREKYSSIRESLGNNE